MDNLKPATLVVFNEYDEIESVWTFDDHNDAVDMFDTLREQGKGFVMGDVPVIHFSPGNKPESFNQPRLL